MCMSQRNRPGVCEISHCMGCTLNGLRSAGFQAGTIRKMLALRLPPYPNRYRMCRLRRTCRRSQTQLRIEGTRRHHQTQQPQHTQHRQGTMFQTYTDMEPRMLCGQYLLRSARDTRCRYQSYCNLFLCMLRTKDGLPPAHCPPHKACKMYALH